MRNSLHHQEEEFRDQKQKTENKKTTVPATQQAYSEQQLLLIGFRFWGLIKLSFLFQINIQNIADPFRLYILP